MDRLNLVLESKILYDNKKLHGGHMVRDFLKEIELAEKAAEEFHILYLNAKNQIMGKEMVSKGTLNASLVHPRQVFKGALLANAHALILAHNHSSGDVEPSTADKTVTETLVRAGKLLDVKIINHAIVGRTGRYFSFSEASMHDS